MPDRYRLVLDDPWTVDPADFPSDGIPAEKLLFLLNYAVLAPSILNAQPWRFRVSGDGVEIFTDQTRLLPVTDPEGREMTISCGAALLNLRVAMRGFGCGCEIEIHSGATPPDPLADVKLKGAETPSESDRQLRDAIPARRTNRRKLDERPLSSNLLEDISAAAQQEGATLKFVVGTDAKLQAMDLVGKAEQTLLADQRYRQELGHWIQQRVGEASAMHGEAQMRVAGHLPSLSAQPDLSTPKAVSTARLFPPGEEALARHRAHLATAPVLGLLVTDDDTPASWVAAGQALQRALLVTTVAGASASFLNPPIEVPTLRPKLARIFGSHAVPQVLLRFGYGPDIPPEARRPLREVVV